MGGVPVVGDVLDAVPIVGPAIKGLVSKPKAPPTPAAPTPPRVPAPKDTANANFMAEAAKRAARTRATTGGRAGSVLTSPLGLTESAETAKRMLLGR